MDSAEELGMTIENLDETRSRRDYNRYVIAYDSVIPMASDALKAAVLLETSYTAVSFPTVLLPVHSYIGDMMEQEAPDAVEEYNLNPFEMKVQGIDRTLADKVFAVCDYYLQGKVAKHSRHLYDIYKLLPLVPQDENFRELVKDLAAVFKTRIELRQIGVRDETKILGGIGICGRCLCCHTYLSEFAPVSIKMAKEQNLSLNQTKISGVCGRLMCCLKNEQETYEELNKNLPGTGDTVTLPDGLQGTVHSVNVLRQRVKVIVEVNDEKEIQEFSVNELKFRPRKKKAKVFEREGKETKESEQKEGDSKSHGKKSAE